ncbi:S9 family peptidase [Bacillus sp. 31A1R]|uniref:S9 family peptidase n=1 Tax=Robertmurraya mangrovi TaxID=3098077 RepID=A0ABU5ISZ7_9BACI|nr:S9 family peptidase [Bacillus sp. 31A1R]MDZ5470241.1 S9 family peptidase [Bacillus sp. 31A1R]
MEKQKRTLTAEDLYHLKSLADPQLAKNGSDLLYVETTMSKEKNDYVSNLYYINVAEKTNPVQWTYGENKNHSPRWSPDGSQIAFVSNRTGKNQIYILQKDGGEARQVTNSTNGASNPVWSPDGSKIAFSTSLKSDEALLLEEKKEEEKGNLVPLVVDKMKYKSDASGFWNGRFTQIAVVDVNTKEMELLTSGERDYSLQSWSPDGNYIALTADFSEELDHSFLSDVYLLEVSTKNLQKVTNSTGYFGSVTWSPNSKFLGMIGHEREFENATLSKAWVYNVDNKSLNCLTSETDLLVGDLAIGDFQQGAVTPGLLWGEDNESFYFLATDHGNTVVYYGSVNGELYPALLDQQHVYGLTTGGNINQAVVAISKAQSPGELFYLDVPTGELTQLTNANASFLDEVQLASVEEIEFKSKDDWDLHGWLMKPANFKEGEKYPLILEIHGGPHAMYANTYFHEFQTLAAEGYAVLYINPRGSHGYGQKFVDAVRGDYGGRDYADVMEAVDYVLDQFDFIDENRLGVTGGSYGGFMTNWIVGHTNSFKAAVTQRSISNWISFYGVSDIGYYFNEWQIKSNSLDDIQTLWKHSPLAYVDSVETPLLILHSEKDYRCPIEQAEQLYIALKHKKKTTKFVRFPESNHELSRSGKPNLRMERLHHIKNWFNEYIK